MEEKRLSNAVTTAAITISFVSVSTVSRDEFGRGEESTKLSVDGSCKMDLRPYQESARQAIHREWLSVDRTLLVLPTGTGKTIVFASVTRDIVEAGGRVLIMAHRGELLQQAADKLERATGLACAVEKAEQESHDSLFRVTVGSVQSLCRQSRLDRFAEDHFTHVICDEAHHCISPSWQTAIQYFAGAKILGVTATPDRTDRKNLGSYFQSLAYEYTLIAAIRDKWLCPIRALSIPLQIDLSNVRQSAGDFRADDLGDALAPYLDKIADEMKEHCTGRKTLVFTPLVDTARKFSAMLDARGFRAAWVSGDHPDRAEILADYAAGKYDVLCNSMLLTEGYDDPPTDCIVCLRPTKARSLYAQIVGRGTRLHPGKENLLLLDFLWLSEKHELCRPAHLIADTAEIAKKMTEEVEAAGAAGMEIDEESVGRAQKEVVAEYEERLAKELAAQKSKQRKLVDPLQYAVSTNAADLADYQPAFGWEAAPMSDKQRDALEKAGIFAGDVKCAGMAAKLLDHVQNRRMAGCATPRQIRQLERFGFAHAGEMPFAAANRLMTRISANGWRLPDDLAERVRKERTPQPKPAEQMEAFA